MLGHTPQCSGVSTQVLAECTPALAGEGRKNQSLLVPNVLERAEERRSTLEGVSESRTGRGETEASGSPHRLAKGKQRSTPAWTWVRRAPARRSRPTRSAGTSRAQERRGCRATNLVVPGRAVLERPHRWRGEHRDCRDSAVAGERRQRGRVPPAHASAPRRVDASRPGAEQARTSGATRACRGGRLFQPPDIGVQTGE